MSNKILGLEKDWIEAQPPEKQAGFMLGGYMERAGVTPIDLARFFEPDYTPCGKKPFLETIEKWLSGREDIPVRGPDDIVFEIAAELKLKPRDKKDLRDAIDKSRKAREELCAGQETQKDEWHPSIYYPFNKIKILNEAEQYIATHVLKINSFPDELRIPLSRYVINREKERDYPDSTRSDFFKALDEWIEKNNKTLDRDRISPLMRKLERDILQRINLTSCAQAR